MRALVLSAGYGTRLRELTRDLPKPMLDVCGRPMIEWILRHLATSGFTEVMINLHHKTEVIKTGLGDGRHLGVQLSYVHEPDLLGTAGAVRNAADFLAARGTFLVQYGDVVTDQDLEAMLAFHKSRPATATILVHRRKGSNSIVDFDDDGRIHSFLERPSTEALRASTSDWVNSGITICEPELVEDIPPGDPSDLPRDVFPALVREGRLFAVPLTGFRCAVDSPERLRTLRDAIGEGRVRIEPGAAHAGPRGGAETARPR